MNEQGETRFGLEHCLAQPPAAMRDGRFGLLMNQASLDTELRFACDVLAERFPGQLLALFSPQHGLWGEQQANMIESTHGRYEPLALPVYSLYSETRKPLGEWLQGLDCLVVDLQDVGTRVYTFAWTVTLCLEACAETRIPLILLDRPNPIGDRSEGPLLEAGWESFVGRLGIPLRHGLSLGELTRLANRELSIQADLQVVTVPDWNPHVGWPATGRYWIPPSPNIPRPTSTLVYPGQVLLEGTNLSEGRGTTQPFELVGAPFVDPHRLAAALNEWHLPAVSWTPTRFRPTFDKWQNEVCGGVVLHVRDAASFEPVRTTLSILATVHRLWPNEFRWLPPPYEYETTRMPIDILFGNDRFRLRLDAGSIQSPDDVTELLSFDRQAWRARVSESLLYQREAEPDARSVI